MEASVNVNDRPSLGRKPARGVVRQTIRQRELARYFPESVQLLHVLRRGDHGTNDRLSHRTLPDLGELDHGRRLLQCPQVLERILIGCQMIISSDLEAENLFRRWNTLGRESFYLYQSNQKQSLKNNIQKPNDLAHDVAPPLGKDVRSG
jgi:hypothetical protein